MTPPHARHPSWYEFINIDLLCLILRNSVFHPYVTALVPLCLRAVGIPYSDAAFRNTVIWAALVGLVWLLAPLNERLSYGKPRPVTASREIVVITGGARGLGRCVSELYALQGITTVVLDIKEALPPRDPVEGVEYFECDVSDELAVQRTWTKIIDRIGTPSVLFNNAGVVNDCRMLEQTSAQVAATFAVNTAAHFTLARLFINTLLAEHRPGTLVTISSVLGRLGAARLSAYTASKAALIAYHNSITAELRQDGYSNSIKTILVTTGHLSTEMFANIRQNAVQRFLGPTVEIQQLALSLVRLVGEGRGGVLAEPLYARWIGILDLLPTGVSRVLRDLAGVDTAMAT